MIIDSRLHWTVAALTSGCNALAHTILTVFTMHIACSLLFSVLIGSSLYQSEGCNVMLPSLRKS